MRKKMQKTEFQLINLASFPGQDKDKSQVVLGQYFQENEDNLLENTKIER